MTGIRAIAGIAALTLSCSGASVSAQTSSAQQGTAPCEVHIWSTGDVKAQSGTALGAGLLESLLRGGIDDDRNHAKLEDGLDVPTQLETFSLVDLARLLHLPADTKIVPHMERLAKKEIKQKRRHSTSTAECYGEIVIVGQIFGQHPIWGGDLRTDFYARGYKGDRQMREFRRSTNHKVKLLGKSGVAADAVRTELTEVFKDNIVEFTALAPNLFVKRTPWN